ncbi:hypothetical protein P154DRAFT_273688 [Amniculicola lignicola CBS 123094]|uniref:Uncharacterized protein n=1 Tax=Amniculicola lignicola CBS 123094 TaxID=1392246 RepID=A0A6A5WAA9_9PLEO|nr:hypothetical protein P154DRAFT_273688 [Amniculicola lignicola CBS 123094]
MVYNRASVDEEMAAMTPEERAAYLKDFEEAEKDGKPKRGSLIERLIERGNKKTEEEIQGGNGYGGGKGKDRVIHQHE